MKKENPMRSNLAQAERDRCLAILADEINLARTTKSGKTSRLTAAWMRIKNPIFCKV